MTVPHSAFPTTGRWLDEWHPCVPVGKILFLPSNAPEVPVEDPNPVSGNLPDLLAITWMYSRLTGDVTLTVPNGVQGNKSSLVVYRVAAVGAVLTVGFSHARCPGRNRTSSIGMGHGAENKSSVLSFQWSVTTSPRWVRKRRGPTKQVRATLAFRQRHFVASNAGIFILTLIMYVDIITRCYCGVTTSGVRSQESGVRSQESGVRSQEPGRRRQELEDPKGRTECSARLLPVPAPYLRRTTKCPSCGGWKIPACG